MGQDQSVIHRVVVYLKPGCHLCEDALAMLNRLRDEFQLTIEPVNIEKDAALFKKYFDQIPVLIIDDHLPLTAPIRADIVRSVLLKG